MLETCAGHVLSASAASERDVDMIGSTNRRELRPKGEATCPR